MRGKVLEELDQYGIYPGSHYVTPDEHRKRAIESIREELLEWLPKLAIRREIAGKTAPRAADDVRPRDARADGILPRHRELQPASVGRNEGDPPPTLLDYFPDDFLVILDESHITVPQLGAMFKGDRSRKETLVEHGFRMPSALDNRPLRFAEWEKRVGQVVHVSATPGDWEIEQARGVVVEQVIRPTGLLDPQLHVRPTKHQVDDLLGEIRGRVARNERVLVTTLTKRMSEDLTEYYSELGVRVRYLHSDVNTLERVEILRDLRRGEFDVLVGINLLREGLDLPEVSLVGILDADKEGFLRSARSLIQTIGRAARNAGGEVTSVRRPDHQLDALRDGRNRTPTRAPDRVQPGARHHSPNDQEGRPRDGPIHRRWRLRRDPDLEKGRSDRRPCRHPSTHRGAPKRDAARRGGTRV